ncbi:hypothetical protein ACS0TY_011105 [Phlomoides rotata]
MYRSASANRIWDRESSHHHHHHRRHRSEDIEELPTYDPNSDAAKKERVVARFAGNFIHAIPFLLLFCAFLLWFFSSPTEIEFEGSLVGAKIQGQRNTIDSDDNPLDLGNMDGSFREIRMN